MVADTLPPIQMLWFGAPLSAVEQVSIASFLHHGHAVRLYAYDEIGSVPDGTTLMDAGEIIPAETFRELRAKGVRPGIFSDLFRYTLLHRRGGWWTDCDVVCLRPFDFTSEFVYGWQDSRVINNAVLRFPAGHKATEMLVAQTLHPTRVQPGDTPRRLARKGRDALRGRRTIESVTWGATGPAAVTGVVKHLRMVHHAMATEVFYPVSWADHERLFRAGELGFGSASYSVHIWNEVRGKLAPEPGSPLHGWMDAFGVSAPRS